MFSAWGEFSSKSLIVLNRYVDSVCHCLLKYANIICQCLTRFYLSRKSSVKSCFIDGRLVLHTAFHWMLFSLEVCSSFRLIYSILRSSEWTLPASIRGWTTAMTNKNNDFFIQFLHSSRESVDLSYIWLSICGSQKTFESCSQSITSLHINWVESSSSPSSFNHHAIMITILNLAWHGGIIIITQ